MESVVNAKNKLKTCDLIGIDTHILYHRMNTEWGWGLFKKQTVVGVVRVVAITHPHSVFILCAWYTIWISILIKLIV